MLGVKFLTIFSVLLMVLMVCCPQDINIQTDPPEATVVCNAANWLLSLSHGAACLSVAMAADRLYFCGLWDTLPTVTPVTAI